MEVLFRLILQAIVLVTCIAVSLLRRSFPRPLEHSFSYKSIVESEVGRGQCQGRLHHPLPPRRQWTSPANSRSSDCACAYCISQSCHIDLEAASSNPIIPTSLQQAQPLLHRPRAHGFDRAAGELDSDTLHLATKPTVWSPSPLRFSMICKHSQRNHQLCPMTPRS